MESDNHQELAIEVSHVCKSFKVFKDRGFMLKDVLLFANRRKSERRTVLNDISFNVRRGEVLGLIGHNGCGKSTTLKLLTRIMYPDSGTIKMNGRVSSLIELGAGFHPDMSGRENIYINASIFGLSREEIDERLEDIIAFSELQEFIDNPVRTYSSGMYMRLAFSVAINVNADILLIDEILAVGDANFQIKCFNKMREIKTRGTTIVLVSHSLPQVEQLCDRCIWINDGKIAADGDPREVDLTYLDYMNQERKIQIEREEQRKGIIRKDTEKEEKQIEIVGVMFLDGEGKEGRTIHTGNSCTILLRYLVRKPVEDAVFSVSIVRNDGLLCFGTSTRDVSGFEKLFLKEKGWIQLQIANFNLIPAEYTIQASVGLRSGMLLDHVEDDCRIEVISNTRDKGIAQLDAKWRMDTA